MLTSTICLHQQYAKINNMLTSTIWSTLHSLCALIYMNFLCWLKQEFGGQRISNPYTSLMYNCSQSWNLMYTWCLSAHQVHRICQAGKYITPISTFIAVPFHLKDHLTHYWENIVYCNKYNLKTCNIISPKPIVYSATKHG